MCSSKPMGELKINIHEKEIEPVILTAKNKITNLNDDCLEVIFGNFDWLQLLSTADSSHHFYSATCLEFKRKYGHSIVTIGGFGSMSTLIPLRNTDKISILNPVTALKFLRNFGHLIWHLQINCRFIRPELCEEIEHYLNKYCSKMLNNLSLYSISSKSLFSGCIETFENIDTLHLESCKFNGDLNMLKLFSRLRLLHLVGRNQFKNTNAIRVSLKSVSDLTIQVNKFEEADITEMLKLNPQLEQLDIYPIYSHEIVRCINEYLPNLRTLILRFLSSQFYTEDPLFEPIHLEHVEEFLLEIDLPVLRNFPFSFGKLKNLFIKGPLELNQNCIQFLEGLNDLKYLTISEWTDEENNIQRFFELRNIRSNLEQLSFTWLDDISTDTVLTFLHQSQSLKRITINGSEFNENINDLRIGLTEINYKMRNGLHSRQFIIEKVNT